MASPTLRKRPRRPLAHRPGVVVQPRNSASVFRADLCSGRRIASNFAFLSLAELVCRATSILVSFSLMRRLGVVGYGRIEFAFNIVFWLVLLVRDSSDVIVARELSRHPRLIKPIVDHVLAIKGMFSLILFAGLALVGSLTLRNSADWWVLVCYGLMLFTTASGLDFVYRGTECMGLLAVSLSLRTFIYAVGVLWWVGRSQPDRLGSGLPGDWRDDRHWSGLAALPQDISRAPAASGLSGTFRHRPAGPHGLFDPALAGRHQHGRPDDRGNLELGVGTRVSTDAAPDGHGAAHVRLDLPAGRFSDTLSVVAADGAGGREALDSLVEVLMTALVPIAIGTTILAEPMVRLLPEDYADAGLLLALGIWRAPLLILAFLYQTTLIALNREVVGVRSLALAAVGIGPLVAVMRVHFGLPGAAGAVILLGLGLVLAGYGCLAREGRQPAWHHHLARPLAASAVMVPVCLILERWHVILAVLGGAVAYSLVMICLGGLGRTRLWRSAFRDVTVTTPAR